MVEISARAGDYRRGLVKAAERFERESTDVILARDDGQLHVFLRAPEQPDHFAAQGIGEAELRALINGLVAQQTRGPDPG